MSPHVLMQAGAAPSTGVPEWLPGGLMALGVAFVTFWTLVRLSGRYKRRSRRAIGPNAFASSASRSNYTGGQTAPREQGSASDRANTHHDSDIVRAELQSLMVDVQEVTRQCAAQIENRAAMLDRLIDDADRRINHLENLLRETSRQHPDAGDAPGSQMNLQDQPAPSPRTRPARPASQPHADDPLTRRVLEMASRGHSPVHIASALNEQVGKVQLILALNAPAPTASTGSG